MNPNFLELFPYTIQPYDNLQRLAQQFHTTVEAIITVNPTIQSTPLYVGQTINIPNTFQMARQTKYISQAKVDFKSNRRLLWEQHVAWTRMSIISLTFDLPDTAFVIARLLRNATDMGNSLRPYYGDQVADQYSNLIKDHLLTAADLVKAAIAHDEKLTMETEKKWYKNADDIAAFWGMHNPFLSVEDVRKMFYEHLDLTKTEAVCMIIGEYKLEVEVYDSIEALALKMADAVSSAIIMQFPRKFR